LAFDHADVTADSGISANVISEARQARSPDEARRSSRAIGEIGRRNRAVCDGAWPKVPPGGAQVLIAGRMIEF
jgi:hypothetical protein